MPVCLFGFTWSTRAHYILSQSHDGDPVGSLLFFFGNRLSFLSPPLGIFSQQTYTFIMGSLLCFFISCRGGMCQLFFICLPFDRFRDWLPPFLLYPLCFSPVVPLLLHGNPSLKSRKPLALVRCRSSFFFPFVLHNLFTTNTRFAPPHFLFLPLFFIPQRPALLY